MKKPFTKCIQATLLGSALLLSISAQAAQPSVASLEKLAQAMQLKHNLETMMEHAIPPQVKQDMLEQMLPKDKQITPEQRQGVTKAFEKFITQISDAVNTPDMRDQFMKAFVESSEKILTQEEVDAMIHFYETPVGQSIIKKQPEWMQDYMGKFMPGMLQKQRQAMIAALPELKETVNKILDIKDDAEKK